MAEMVWAVGWQILTFESAGLSKSRKASMVAQNFQQLTVFKVYEWKKTPKRRLYCDLLTRRLGIRRSTGVVESTGKYHEFEIGCMVIIHGFNGLNDGEDYRSITNGEIKGKTIAVYWAKY